MNSQYESFTVLSSSWGTPLGQKGCVLTNLQLECPYCHKHFSALLPTPLQSTSKLDNESTVWRCIHCQYKGIVKPEDV